MALGLDDSHVPFLWCTKEEHRSCLPEGFIERTREIGMLVSWAPQLSVLSHMTVAVFVSLSGWKEVLESISVGGSDAVQWRREDGGQGIAVDLGGMSKF